ncbi:hypothetical protein FGKAn22_19230 [Ferrigenium kumadai]|uniref:PilZ domain-containing protein n=1 Tax=Ferrigenium kumadai TaxID=1682490 RepID=A0AAN1T1H5_9PROT|nr:hypothetical protein [Ferrigenium kumadai]BBJ00231.1 hypothetical protein FGKAn22_19230 [Ferrigenium kumadai]
MADIKSAQALLEDLPKNDAHKSLGELTEWIESVSDHVDFRLEHQFAVLRLLDETAQPHVHKLARDYFTPGELGKFQENRLWLALDNFYRHSANAYGVLFDRYSSGDKGGGALREHVPLIATRAMHALARRQKYACAHYCPAGSSIWTDLAKLYRHAEQQNYLDAPVALYPGVGGNTSVRLVAGHLLGWYGCGVSALSPLDIHFVERIVGQYCAAIELGAQLGANSLFSFDLERPAAPMRVKVDSTVHPSMRFVDMSAMQPKLESLLKTLDKNVVPDELNLGGAYEAERVRGAARHLLEYLTDPPLRRSVRRSIKIDMNVVSGFAKVVERAGASPENGEDRAVYWEIEDISSSGFRAVLPAQGIDGIRIGTLLGVRPGSVSHWGAAVVRRLMRDDANLLHVGAEILSSHAVGVVLSPSGGGVDDGLPALWLQAKPGEPDGEVRLLMKADTFSMHRSLKTGLNGKHYLLIPAGLQEHGLDCDLARFRLVEQEAGGDGDY